MKILIVAAYFPPQNAIASLRPYSWAKWWSKMGHDVTVLTTTKVPMPDDLKLDCSGFKVIDESLELPFRKSRFYVKASENSEITLQEHKKSFKLKVLKNLKKAYRNFCQKTGCFCTCRFPDWHDVWIKKAAKKQNPNDYDVLVTTAGPYSVHFAGLIFRHSGWNGKWICDWRDLWSKNHIFKGLTIFHPLEKHLERKFHKNADVITAVSEPASETLRTLTKTPVFTIYNGFDAEDFDFLFARKRKANQKYIISYLGSIYRGYQDPEPLFQGLGELDKAGLITPEDMVVQFAGNSDVSDLAKKYGVEKYYSYLGFLPRETSLELQYDSDAVLFLEFDNPNVKGVLTGKLFEYLYCAKKILAVGCSWQTSAGELIKEANAGICFGTDVKMIKDYLLEDIQNRKTNSASEFIKNQSVIEQFSRKYQAERVLELANKGNAMKNEFKLNGGGYNSIVQNLSYADLSKEAA